MTHHHINKAVMHQDPEMRKPQVSYYSKTLDDEMQPSAIPG